MVVTMPIDQNSRTVPQYSYVNITAAAPTTTLVKTGSGIFTTGLVIYTATAAQNITITYL